ncbi:MAG TPA: glycosyltransferase family 4 protein [Terracidiphilus sp.]|jgi:glycosyltransferase involved in cell wall biosynthesis|nr:glycosyltransferase family 4 protein [Terracidiphilus sp.]
MKPRVIIITGSAPPDACGVGDYAALLVSGLQDAGIQAELFHHPRWNLAGTWEALQKLRASKDALIHIQYPSFGYGHSLGPQLCAMMRSCIVTIHEFSAAHVLRRLSIVPFTLRAKSIVTITEIEKQVISRRIPWAGKRIRVITVPSNTPKPKSPLASQRQRIAYFGLIMPNKGIEDFIEAAQIARNRGHRWETAIIGKVPARHREYAQHIFDASRSAGVDLILDQCLEVVSEELAKSALCYLPFPDGVSERRSSLKSACTVGLPCITTRGSQTPAELNDVVRFAANPAEAVEQMVQLMNAPGETARLSNASLGWAEQFSWKRTIELHVQMYSELHRRVH